MFLYLRKHGAMMEQEAVEIQFHAFLSLEDRVVSFTLRRYYSGGGAPWYWLNSTQVGHQSPSGRGEEEKILSPLLGIETKLRGHPTHGLAIIYIDVTTVL
jgi:hypothetical protein